MQIKLYGLRLLATKFDYNEPIFSTSEEAEDVKFFMNFWRIFQSTFSIASDITLTIIDSIVLSQNGKGLSYIEIWGSKYSEETEMVAVANRFNDIIKVVLIFKEG